MAFGTEASSSGGRQEAVQIKKDGHDAIDTSPGSTVACAGDPASARGMSTSGVNIPSQSTVETSRLKKVRWVSKRDREEPKRFVAVPAQAGFTANGSRSCRSFTSNANVLMQRAESTEMTNEEPPRRTTKLLANVLEGAASFVHGGEVGCGQAKEDEEANPVGRKRGGRRKAREERIHPNGESWGLSSHEATRRDDNVDETIACRRASTKRRKSRKRSASLQNRNLPAASSAVAHTEIKNSPSSGGLKTISVRLVVNGDMSSKMTEASVPIKTERTGSSTATAQLKDQSATEPRAEPAIGKLNPLPIANPIPASPCTGRCEWIWNPDHSSDFSRVLLAKFKLEDGMEIHPEDEKFLLQMMERDDITFISEGLVDGLSRNKWDLNFISRLVGDQYYHKFRKFHRRLVQEPESITTSKVDKRFFVAHREVDGFASMKVADYINYLHRRGDALAHIAKEKEKKKSSKSNSRNPEDDNIGRRLQDDGPESFSFVNHDGESVSVNLVDDVLYLIDYDIPRLLPALYEDFASSFKLPGCLPGGKYCMMNAVNSGGRPFMGPNLYVTPPASFTHFHQDGHGTVDSGHLCLSGCNEVIMLRRMPERNKKHALYLLNGKEENRTSYDALYGLPHGDNLGEKPMWPSLNAIQECVDMNYYPSVFILKPGQFVHINKGRLHAFRKMSTSNLPPTDCHSKLRQKNIEKLKLGTSEQICISVAWDWMYRGVTSEGINREIVSTLDCAELLRHHRTQSLAIPETAILHMASHFVSEYEHEQEQEKSVPLSAIRGRETSFLPSQGLSSDYDRFGSLLSYRGPSSIDVLRGLLEPLRCIVNKHNKTIEKAKDQERIQQEGDRMKISIADKPDTWQNPSTFALDPYGNGDFACKLCGEELSNCYYHCDGCCKLLSKDFNICVNCHEEKGYARNIQMHPLNGKRKCTINHTGGFTKDRQERCPCRNGPKCRICYYCEGCSCRCHNKFVLRLRLMSIDDENELLERVEKAVVRQLEPSAPTREVGFTDRVPRKMSTDLDTEPAGEAIIPTDLPSSNYTSRLKQEENDTLAGSESSVNTTSPNASVPYGAKADAIHLNENSFSSMVACGTSVESKCQDVAEESMETASFRALSKVSRRVDDLNCPDDTNENLEDLDQSELGDEEDTSSKTADKKMSASASDYSWAERALPYSSPKPSLTRSTRSEDRKDRNATPLPCEISRNLDRRWDLSMPTLANMTPFEDTNLPRCRSVLIPELNPALISQMFKDNPPDSNATVGSCIRSFKRGLFDENDEKDRDMIFFLYRNFHGENDVVKESRADALYMTRHERDIIVYCIVEKMDTADCMKLMPYRAQNCIEAFYRKTKIECFHENDNHVAHVRKTIGATIENHFRPRLPLNAAVAGRDEDREVALPHSAFESIQNNLQRTGCQHMLPLQYWTGIRADDSPIVNYPPRKY